MNLPTPESDAARTPHREYGLPDQVKYSVASDLEHRFTIARTALEFIARDMAASQMIHNLCVQTLQLIEPKP